MPNNFEWCTLTLVTHVSPRRYPTIHAARVTYILRFRSLSGNSSTIAVTTDSMIVNCIMGSQSQKVMLMVKYNITVFYLLWIPLRIGSEGSKWSMTGEQKCSPSLYTTVNVESIEIFSDSQNMEWQKSAVSVIFLLRPIVWARHTYHFVIPPLWKRTAIANL